MASASVSGALSLPVGQLQDLYDRHRYLDAFALSAAYWNPSTKPELLTTEELVLGGRLAWRLGGARLSRRLLRAADAREPANPRVRYHARHTRSLRWNPLEDLREFEDQPDVGGDDPDVRASWYASCAGRWATLRDFERAYQCLERAHEILPDDAWVLTCESGVHAAAHRWADALRSAERAVEIDPVAPYAVMMLGTCLLHEGRLPEASDRLLAAAAGTQSYELMGSAAWHHCALAETLEGDERRSVLDRAAMLVERLPALAPLADREWHTVFARTRLDLASVSDDHAAMEKWSVEARSTFHRQVLDNLRKNREGRRIRLPFRGTIQDYETCLPASLAAAASANGIAISPDEMASEQTFGGTPEWGAADWLRRRGFHVRYFAVTSELAARLIHEGIAFTLCWDADENGHAVAIVGLDERAGTLLVHDPSSPRLTEYLLSILHARPSPLGIRGMAVVAADAAARLDALLPAEAEVMDRVQEHARALLIEGNSAARPIVSALAESFPGHPAARFVGAAQLLEDGHIGESLGRLQELLREYPHAAIVRVRVLAACHALGNTARLREVLEGIVERGVMPGLQAGQDWIRPPARYVFQYADVLQLSSGTRDQGEALLRSLLAREPNSAGAWHVLADLLTHKGDVPGALLCHRLASCLTPSDEHYARAYEGLLASQKREDEGLRWLEARVRTLGGRAHAVGTWISWVSALEDRGYPERALAACREGLERHPRSPDLLAFAVPFFARMGLWDVAEEHRVALESAGKASAFHEASGQFEQMRGCLDGAIAHCEALLQEAPHSPARPVLLQLLALRDGPEAAVERAAGWVRSNPGHEGSEDVYCAQLDRASSPRRKKYSVLRRRLRTNPEDAWAWREATFDCLQDYHATHDRRRRRLGRLVERLIAECDRTSPENVATLRAHALWFELRGYWSEALDTWLQCIDREPASFYSYERAWQCSSRLPADRRQQVWADMRRSLLNTPGRVAIAREMLALLVTRFGLREAEREVKEWRRERPDDPGLVEAQADLWLEHGHGRSDAQRAVALLRPAVQRYPYHPGLRLSLAHAFRKAGNADEARTVLLEIVRRHPANVVAQVQLAWARQGQGDADGALQALDAASTSEPRNPYVLESRARVLLALGREAAARAAVAENLSRMPGSAEWRSRAVVLLTEMRAHDEAVAAAREGVVVHPRRAEAWLTLARTLMEMQRYAVTGEIEACLRRSLSFDPSSFDSASCLSSLFVNQERYDEAAQLMADIEPRMADPSPARVYQAWVRRRRGETVEAVTDLASVVRSAPWDGIGWNVLCDWLLEDENWDLARLLVRDVPPQVYTNTAFRCRRLQLLQEAGVDRALLDDEWDRLLKDFPDDPGIQSARLATQQAAEKRAAEVPEARRSALASVPWWAWWPLTWLAIHLVRLVLNALAE